MLQLIVNTADPDQNGLLNNFLSPGQGLEQEFVRGDRKLAVYHRPVIPNPLANTILPWADDWLDTDSFEMAIGNPDTPPTGGNFTLGIQRMGSPKAVVSVGATNPGSVNVVAHGMVTGDIAYFLTSTGSTPDLIQQGFVATVVDADDFTVPVDVTGAGAGGTMVSYATSGLQSLVYNISASLLQTAVSAASIALGYPAVSASLFEPGSYELTWNSPGAVPMLYASGGQLNPASTVFVASVIPGDGTTNAVQVLELSQLPVAFATPSTPLPVAAITGSVAQHGAAGPPSVNKVYALVMTTGTYGGTFSISLTTILGVTTSFITQGTVAASDLQQTLNGATGVGSTDMIVTRTADTLNVQFGGTQGGSNAPTIAVANIDLQAPLGVTGTMDLNTVNLYLAFAQTTSDTLPFTFAIRRTRATGEEAEYFQHAVVLKRNLINASTIVPVTLPGYYTQAQIDAKLAAYMLIASAVANPILIITSGGTQYIQFNNSVMAFINGINQVTLAPSANTNGSLLVQIPDQAGTLELSNWIVKSSSFTASIFGKYQVDCSASAVTMTLPTGMVAGDSIEVQDASLSFGTHTFTITVAASGLATKINSGTSSYTDSVVGDKITLTGINSTVGVSIK